MVLSLVMVACVFVLGIVAGVCGTVVLAMVLMIKKEDRETWGAGR